MVTIAHKLRLFFDTVVFFIWGQTTLEIVSDIAAENIKISLIDGYMKFMFSFVGLTICRNQDTHHRLQNENSGFTRKKN